MVNFVHEVLIVCFNETGLTELQNLLLITILRFAQYSILNGEAAFFGGEVGFFNQIFLYLNVIENCIFNIWKTISLDFQHFSSSYLINQHPVGMRAGDSMNIDRLEI